MSIKIALYKGTRAGAAGIYNRAVRAWTKGPYSHCELIAQEHDDGTVTCWGSSFSDHGVRKKTMPLDPLKWDVIEVPGALADAVEWFEAHTGDGYDIVGNVGFICRPVADDSSKWFCSEAVMAALGYADAWRFCPNTLAAALKH